jgi:hypothetical protein
MQEQDLNQAEDLRGEHPADVRPSRRVPIFHPLLFAAHPVLDLFTRNTGEMDLWQLWRPLATSMAGAALFWLLASLYSRSAYRGAVAATAGVFVFFARGHAARLLPSAWVTTAVWVSVAGLLVLLITLRRTSLPMRDAARVLNFMGLVLVLPQTVPFITMAMHRGDVARFETSLIKTGSNLADAKRVRRIVAKPSRPDLPDIYYIILDAYGREDSLKRVMRFDNTPFLRELQKRGFYIAQHSRANYNQTPLCLASALNMKELDGPAMEALDRGLYPARLMLDKNAVAFQLAEQGYTFVFVSTGEPLAEVESVDIRFTDRSHLSQLENSMLGMSSINANESVDNRRRELHRRFIRTGFTNLQKVPAIQGPKFTFAHFAVPHPPFVFDKDGAPAGDKGAFSTNDGSMIPDLDRQEYIRGYVHQLQYVNKRILETLDRIMAGSKIPPVIILQGDHGSRMGLNWESRDSTDLQETYSILNAYHVPAEVRAKLYPEISPVNSFRILLSTMFSLDLPRIPDRSWYSTFSHPFRFEEVTQLLNQRHTSANPPH